MKTTIFKISDYIKLQPKQLEAFKYVGKGYRIFFGGARGGGKSYLSLCTAMLTALQFPGISIIIIRRVKSSLQEVFIDIMLSRFPQAVFNYKYVAIRTTASFTNGSKIVFRQLDDLKDVEKIKGAQYQLMIIDEANEIPYTMLERIFGSCRNPNPKIAFKPTILQTGNPGGISDSDFKYRYIKPDYSKWNEGELKNKDKYAFIQSFLSDNEYLSKDGNYLMQLEGASEELKKQWLYGDWDTFEGQFFTEFRVEQHVIPPFDIPKDWEKVVGIDLGFTKEHPTVALMGAKDPVSGVVYIMQEYTGSPEGSVIDYAEQILEWVGEHQVSRYYGDPSIWKTLDRGVREGENYGNIFVKSGIPVLIANNAREQGWRIVKQWLSWGENRQPKLKIFDSCFYLVETLPMQQYAKDIYGNIKNDLNTKGKDDWVDALRYLLVSGFEIPNYQEFIQEKIEEDISKFVYQGVHSESELGTLIGEDNLEVERTPISKIRNSRRFSYANYR